ncbi:hypothetical protein [Neisseria sp. 19428wB4_WF04]|uniref:hypothetical protein n=1 Tax=Neisseria TaxID=482 RepID=UPI001D16467A|nr:hypothetical protein [Neisseria sp. 19428wB4_WF04]
MEISILFGIETQDCHFSAKLWPPKILKQAAQTTQAKVGTEIPQIPKALMGKASMQNKSQKHSLSVLARD